MRNYQAEDVDDYIAGAEPATRPHLQELRKLVKLAVPKADEGISWGIPFYKYRGLLAGFSPFKHHVSFGFAFQLGDDYRQILEQKGYKTGSKTVQIKFDQKIPATEIAQMLKAQAKYNEAKQAAK